MFTSVFITILSQGKKSPQGGAIKTNVLNKSSLSPCETCLQNHEQDNDGQRGSNTGSL